ncbi:MAG: SCO family protein [Rhodocyclaceae bacterium]|nr:SCO family protein [Rhodocyclaceae bacterium]
MVKSKRPIFIRLVLVLAMLVLAAWVIGRYYAPTEQQVATPMLARILTSHCNLQQNLCSASSPEGVKISLVLSPRPVEYFKSIRAEVVVEGAAAESVQLDFSGADMGTSFNRQQLQPSGEAGHFSGEVMLPVCSKASMDWQATVLTKVGDKNIAIPFLFNTDPSVKPVSKPRILDSPPRGGNFAMNAATGPISLDRLRGKVVVLFFSYLASPDSCPNPTNVAAEAFAQLTPSEAEKVRGFMVSLDPTRDTPALLAQRLRSTHPSLIGSSGGDADLVGATRMFGAAFSRHSGATDGKQLIDYSPMFYLLSAEGKLVGQLPAFDADKLLKEIRALLSRGAPETTRKKQQ